MNTAARVALDKQKHPERFCKEPRCLWRVVKLDHATQTFSPRPDCPNGRCPRHQTAGTTYDYSKRVQELEAEGLCTSDAQSVADVEFSKAVRP